MASFDTSTHYTGSKHKSGRDIKDVAKDVRKDIKAAIKAGTIPKVKCSVRIERFAGGRALRVSVTEAAFPVINPGYIHKHFVLGLSYWEDAPTPHPLGHDKYTPIADRVLEEIKAIVAAYNFDKSETITDYWCVSFYETIEYGWKLRESQEEKIKAHMEVN